LLVLGATAFASTVGAQSAPHMLAVGERSEYDVSYGVVRAGRATVSVASIDNVRDHPAYCLRFTMNAGVNLLLYRYSIHDTMRSWVDTATFQSLRFYQDQHDGGRIRTKRYEIFPDRRVFKDGADDEEPSVGEPLDDLAFLFFARQQNLDVGATRSFDRYFKPSTNPVSLKVLNKDTIEVAGKRWPAIVVRPIIKTSSLFAEGAEARVWMSDDPAHVILQLNVKMKVGSITMKLRSYEHQDPGDTPSGSAGRI
jgi:hypothetical protein